jgi:hypothetical protein
MKEELLPFQFVKGEGGTYVRRRDDQIHLIYFQGSKYGGEFRVNLAIHFAFIPPLFRRRRIKLHEFHLLDCSLRTDLCSFDAKNRDWLKYGHDRAALRQILVNCASESLLILDRHAELWADPMAFLAFLKSGLKGPWRCEEKDLVLGCVEMRVGQFDEAQASLQRWYAASRAIADAAVHETLKERLAKLRSSGASAAKAMAKSGEWDWVAPP